MKQTYLFFFLFSLLVGSCDDGNIYESDNVFVEDGKTLKFTGILNGINSWSEDYTLAVAGFGSNGNYALISKAIPVNDDENIQITLSGIKNDVKDVELCIINRLREKIISFTDIDISSAGDTIYMDVGTVDVGMFSSIQEKVLNTTCAHCHGGGNHAAAGLYLTDGNSYESLVGKESKKFPGMLIVNPGRSEESLIHKMLNTNITSEWGYDHSKEILQTDILKLIDNWIENGAKK